MNGILKNLAGAILPAALALMFVGPTFASSIAEKAALQAAMQRHIDRSLVDGAFLYLDTQRGEIKKLYPKKAHPMILKMGEYFVLCSDFQDVGNASVNIDFYLANENGRYVVFDVSVDEREALRRWMSEGKAKRLN